MENELKYYSIQQVSKLLNVSRTTLFNFRNRKENPLVFVKIGMNYKISHVKLKKWIENEQ